jgi:hypothetical protein
VRTEEISEFSGAMITFGFVPDIPLLAIRSIFGAFERRGGSRGEVGGDSPPESEK